MQLDPDMAYAYTLAAHEFVANEQWEKAVANFRQAVGQFAVVCCFID